MTGGAQTALYAIVRVLAEPGDAICVPDLTYPGLRAIAEQLKVRLVPVAMDGEGLDPAALGGGVPARAAEGGLLRPDHPQPDDRDHVGQAARGDRRGGPSPWDRDHRGRCLRGAAPAGPDTDRGARAGDHLAHRHPVEMRDARPCGRPTSSRRGLADTLRLAAEIRAMTLMVPPLMAALASKWILDGTLDAITAAIREESAARQAIARRVLQGLEFQAHPEGHHLWLTLPERWRRADLNVYARQSGLALVPSEAFAVGTCPGCHPRIPRRGAEPGRAGTGPRPAGDGPVAWTQRPVLDRVTVMAAPITCRRPIKAARSAGEAHCRSR